jgi:WD40 repeat protein
VRLEDTCGTELSAAVRRDEIGAMNFVRHFCLIATAAFVLALWPALLARAQTSTADQLGHTDTVESAAFSPDGSRVVTASDDHTARIWDAKTGAALITLSGHTNWVHSAVFSPDGTRIVTASADKTARIWDAKTGAALATLSGHTDGVLSAAFSPDGTRVVTASFDTTARIWDAKTGAAIATLSGHTDTVESAAFSPDGNRVVTASDDHTARIWDAKTWAALATLGHMGCTRSEKQTCAWRWLTCTNGYKLTFPNDLGQVYKMCTPENDACYKACGG